MRGWSICLFLNLFVCLYTKGQKITTAIPFDKQNMVDDTTKRNINAGKPGLSKLAVNPFSNISFKPVPSTFYFNSIGFFCQKELQIEKALSFPVKFRLGSVAYTDQMEGKGKETRLSYKQK
ncbi:MAG: hypothetical protein WKG06_34810 [Segetibacter sp.]